MGSGLALGKSGGHEFTHYFEVFWSADRFCTKMYETFNSKNFHGKGFAISEEEFEDTKRLLGREPDGYEEFVKAEAAEWTKT